MYSTFAKTTIFWQRSSKSLIINNLPAKALDKVFAVLYLEECFNGGDDSNDDSNDHSNDDSDDESNDEEGTEDSEDEECEEDIVWKITYFSIQYKYL